MQFSPMLDVLTVLNRISECSNESSLLWCHNLLSCNRSSSLTRFLNLVLVTLPLAEVAGRLLHLLLHVQPHRYKNQRSRKKSKLCISGVTIRESFALAPLKHAWSTFLPMRLGKFKNFSGLSIMNSFVHKSFPHTSYLARVVLM